MRDVKTDYLLPIPTGQMGINSSHFHPLPHPADDLLNLRQGRVVISGQEILLFHLNGCCHKSSLDQFLVQNIDIIIELYKLRGDNRVFTEYCHSIAIQGREL